MPARAARTARVLQRVLVDAARAAIAILARDLAQIVEVELQVPRPRPASFSRSRRMSAFGGPYGFYVSVSYAATVLILGAVVWKTWADARAARRRLEELERDRAAR